MRQHHRKEQYETQEMTQQTKSQNDVARKRNNYHSHNWRKILSVLLSMISVSTIPVNRVCIYPVINTCVHQIFRCIRKRKRPAITSMYIYHRAYFFPWLTLGKLVDYDGKWAYVSDLGTHCDSITSWPQGH